MVKNLPVNAGDTGSIPGPGRFHMPQSNMSMGHKYWSLRALEPVLHSKKSHHSEKPMHHN